MEEIKFCVIRNTDNTLSVYFSDDSCVLGFNEADVDAFVFDYKPDAKKTQVFDLDQFQDTTCH